jgi:hypothetical protein
MCHGEVRILIFDDLAENERGQHLKFYSSQLYSTSIQRHVYFTGFIHERTRCNVLYIA